MWNFQWAYHWFTHLSVIVLTKKELTNRKIRSPHMNDITINEYKVEHNEVDGDMKSLRKSICTWQMDHHWVLWIFINSNFHLIIILKAFLLLVQKFNFIWALQEYSYCTKWNILIVCKLRKTFKLMILLISSSEIQWKRISLTYLRQWIRKRLIGMKSN